VQSELPFEGPPTPSLRDDNVLGRARIAGGDIQEMKNGHTPVRRVNASRFGI
jgi:hypothetical protein